MIRWADLGVVARTSAIKLPMAGTQEQCMGLVSSIVGLLILYSKNVLGA